MKKIFLVFSAMISVILCSSQTDAGVILNCPFEISSSGSDNNFIATLPTGENIMASQINDGSSNIINITKILLNGSVSTTNNILIPSSTPNLHLRGLTCSSTGEYTCFFGGINDFYLIKFSFSGVILWEKKLDIPELYYQYYNHTINETSLGDYYLSFSVIGFMGIVKIDSNGNFIWSKKLAGPINGGKCPGFCSEVTQTGGCISTLKDGYYETIINLASDGSLIWSKSYVDFTYRWTRSIKADNLGNFYIMGTYESGGPTPSSPASTFIQKIDSNGNFIFANNVSGMFRCVDMKVTASNDLLLLSPSPIVRLLNMSATGTFLSQKAIPNTTGGFSYYYSTFFSKTPSSNISFASWLNDTIPLVTKFSGDLSELCKSINGSSLPTTSPDAAILAAEVDTIANINPFIVNVTNSTFTTSTTEYYTSEDFCSLLTNLNETYSSDLNIYPNPATDFVNIELGNLKNEDLQNAVIVVYDMTGKKVFEKQLNNSSMEKISTADYAAGLFTIIIANSNHILAKQRVIVQK